MAITPLGFAGDINAQRWARYSTLLGKTDIIISGFTGTVVTGQTRQVALSAGHAYAWGVEALMASPTTLTFENVTSGTRWDAVVLRYDWEAKTITPVIIKGSSVEQIPARYNDPGRTKFDQPVLLVQLTAGNTLPTAVRNLQGIYPDHEPRTYVKTLTGSQIDNANNPAGAPFPSQAAVTVSVPPWATRCTVLPIWSGVRVAGGSSFGSMWVRIGGIDTEHVGYNTPAIASGEDMRFVHAAPANFTVPSRLQGLTVTVEPYALGPATGGFPGMDSASSFALHLDFIK